MNRSGLTMYSWLAVWRRTLGCILIAYVIALVLGTHLPRNAMPDIAGKDKAIHFAAYAVLACLTLAYFAACWGNLGVRAVGIAVALALFAALDEYTQQFVPGRFADTYDWLYDSAGVLFAVIGWSALMMRVRSHTADPDSAEG